MEITYLWVIAFLLHTAYVITTGPQGDEAKAAKQFWHDRNAKLEMGWLRKATASLRYRYPPGGHGYGHISAVVLLTAKHGITSALVMELVNEEHQEYAHDNLWNKHRLIILHNDVGKSDWWNMENYNYGWKSNVTDVIFCPGRPQRRSIRDPSKTNHDLALIKYNCTSLTVLKVKRLCTIPPAFQTPGHVYEYEYPFKFSYFKAKEPLVPVAAFSRAYDAQVVNCSVGALWGYFFCIEPVLEDKNIDPKPFPYGLEAGAAVWSYNATLIGIASFSLRMGSDDKVISYITDLSYPIYRQWILDKVYNITNITWSEADHSLMRYNTCHQWNVPNGLYPHGMFKDNNDTKFASLSAYLQIT